MQWTLEPPPDDGVLAAVREAVRRAGLEPPAGPDPYRSAWRRAQLAGDDADDRDPGYAPPRKSLGATRA